MGNDAVGFARKGACGLEGNVLRRQFDHNFDYVTCCGIKALEKLRTSFGENVFFVLRVGKLLKMQALDFLALFTWLLFYWVELVYCGL